MIQLAASYSDNNERTQAIEILRNRLVGRTPQLAPGGQMKILLTLTSIYMSNSDYKQALEAAIKYKDVAQTMKPCRKYLGAQTMSLFRKCAIEAGRSDRYAEFEKAANAI